MLQAAPASAPASAMTAPKMAAVDFSLSYVDVPHSQIRRITAQRLLESKQTIPHYYLSVEVQVGAGRHCFFLHEGVTPCFGQETIAPSLARVVANRARFGRGGDVFSAVGRQELSA